MRWVTIGALSVLVACGGKVVVDQDGSGGQGASGAGASSTVGPGVTSGPGTTGPSTTSVTVGTGPSGCADHADCPGGVCIFATGTCAAACDSEFCPSCGPGSVCNSCATSSCSGCADCVAACQPTTPGQCDDDDPCPADQVCLFSSSQCAPACSSDGECGGFAFCDKCPTGSCCGCDDCVAACIGGE